MIRKNVDNITHIDDAHRQVISPAPHSVKIELTGRCNYRCSFCARSDKLRKMKDMDWNLFTKIVRDMKKSGVYEIGLFYLGESFMDSRLEDAIKYCKDTGFEYVFITTNGSLSTPERMEACFRAGLDSLKFSINYADEQQFTDIARVKTSLYHTMMNNIHSAKAIRDKVHKETGHWCGLYGSYIEYDGIQGERMRAVVESLKDKLDDIYALPLYNQAGFVTEREKAEGMIPTVGNRGRLENMVPGVPCWALFTEGHVTWDGQLAGCCFAHTPDFNYGDLNELSFMDAWNSERAQYFRRNHLNNTIKGTPCENCFALG